MESKDKLTDFLPDVYAPCPLPGYVRLRYFPSLSQWSSCSPALTAMLDQFAAQLRDAADSEGGEEFLRSMIKNVQTLIDANLPIPEQSANYALGASYMLTMLDK